MRKYGGTSAKRLLCFLGIYLAVSRDLRVEEQTELTLQTVLCQLRKVPDFFFLKKACEASIWKGVTAFGTNYLDSEATEICLHFVAQGPLALVHEQESGNGRNSRQTLCLTRERQVGKVLLSLA